MGKASGIGEGVLYYCRVCDCQFADRLAACRFPQTAQNGSSAAVVIKNPWANGGPSAPFDQRMSCFLGIPLFIGLCSEGFYLIIDLAVGGTSGWFPDNKGNKPWYDGSLSMFFVFFFVFCLSRFSVPDCRAAAMRDFARAQDKWYPTWPTNPDDRAFRM